MHCIPLCPRCEVVSARFVSQSFWPLDNARQPPPANNRLRCVQIYDPAFVAEHMVAGNAPGHACEYETSTMLHLFPDRECLSFSSSSSSLSLSAATRAHWLVGTPLPHLSFYPAEVTCHWPLSRSHSCCVCVCVLNVCVSRFLNYVDQASLWKTSTKTARKGTQMPRKAGF